MKNLRKWLIRIGIALLAIVIILAGTGVWFVRRSWPQVDGTIEVAGLSSPVKVIRDQWGVPNIYAENERDLLFAQGYVHAQDRLWQMEMGRRIAHGTLSEAVGQPGVGMDINMRTLAIRQVSEKSLAELDDEYRQLLEAYAEGVNAYINTHRNNLPVEFTLLNVEPAPWTAIDSMALGNVVAVYGSHDFGFELTRSRLIAKLGDKVLEHYLVPQIENTPFIIPPEVKEYSWLPDKASKNRISLGNWEETLSWGFASNTWVVHGSHTDTGMPILANDPHTSLETFLEFYEVGIHGGRFNSSGFSLPGVPLVLFGHNQRIAWGIAILNADMQDGYIEKLDDVKKPTQYEYMGEWHKLKVVSETIKVRNSDPVAINIYWTRHGPIVSDLSSSEPPIAMRWSFHEGSLIFKSVVLLNLAANWDEFRTALYDWNANGFDFTYADVDGNIGYQATGRIPIRTPKHQGIVPVPGWTGEYEWQGFIPPDELPSSFNPPEGFIAVANNKVVSDDYPYILGHFYDPGLRAKRITDLLSAHEKISVNDIKAIHADVYSLDAEMLTPYLLKVEPKNELQAQALDYLKNWNLRFDRDSVAASIYVTWYEFLVKNTLGDDYGQDMIDKRDYVDACYHVYTITKLMTDPKSPWFDDVNTPEIENRDDIVSRSFVEAIDWLSKKYGQDSPKWQWGNLHTWTHTYSPLGRSGIAPLEYIFKAEPVSISGGLFTVNASAWAIWDRFRVGYGVSMRRIVDLSDWDHTLTTNRAGQSGQLFHPHSEDQKPLWQNIEYHPEPFSQEAVEKLAVSTLILTPQR